MKRIVMFVVGLVSGGIGIYEGAGYRESWITVGCLAVGVILVLGAIFLHVDTVAPEVTTIRSRHP